MAPIAAMLTASPHDAIARSNRTHDVIIMPFDHHPAVLKLTIFSENVIDTTKTAVTRVRNAFAKSFISV